MRDSIAEIIDEQALLHGLDTLAAADAIIAALPSMVKPLVWEKGVVDWARLKQGGRYVACSTTPHGSWSWWLDGDDESPEVCANEDAAKSRANDHHRAAIMAAFQEVKP